MAPTLNFAVPEQQNAGVQIVLAPPTSISGWTIKMDIMYRFFSPQPILSLYLASGYAAGQSGITLVNGSTGVFNANLTPAQVSGLTQSTNVICYQTYRMDTGVQTPLNGGYRLLTAF